MTETGTDPGTEAIAARVYRELRRALIDGRMVPGRPVTLRGIATEADVSLTPVRLAVARLVAERALILSDTRRVSVPALDPTTLTELMQARTALEPEAAVRALPAFDAARLAGLRQHDDSLEASLASGDVDGYMSANRAFHFCIYEAAPSTVFTPLIEQLWLRFGPFMRVVYGRVGTARLVDRHEEAMAAIGRRDAPALRNAIAADIHDGMTIIAEALSAG
jgi:DNA-binding GntR family transcriptional regulator